MQKWISPARILGRKNSFCSSVPKFMMVGPTVLMVSMGTGAPAPHRLVEEDELLDGRAALAAVLLGPADPEPPVARHLLGDAAHGGPDAVAQSQLRLDLGGEEVGVVVAQLLAQCLLLLGVADLHARPALLLSGRTWNRLHFGSRTGPAAGLSSAIVPEAAHSVVELGRRPGGDGPCAAPCSDRTSPQRNSTYPGDDDPRSAHAAVLASASTPRRPAVADRGEASARSRWGRCSPDAPPWDPGRREAWRVRGMATAPDGRGRGLGSRVLDALVDHVGRARRRPRVVQRPRPGPPPLRAGRLRGAGEVFDIPGIGPHVRMWRALECRTGVAAQPTDGGPVTDRRRRGRGPH